MTETASKIYEQLLRGEATPNEYTTALQKEVRRGRWHGTGDDHDLPGVLMRFTAEELKEIHHALAWHGRPKGKTLQLTNRINRAIQKLDQTQQ